MIPIDARRVPPNRSAAEKANYELSNAAGWLFDAIAEQMQVYIGTSPADRHNVGNCIDYLESQLRILKLVDRELCGGKS